ncbi:unnamed protein product [Effrenium voratum]|uniref:Uncharacterized protein n=1 Tax=Effrenium voratum TaxID=2562239 RepID=A0AA36JCJ3_9DINO|nr:unnamed protein product [Effrenium voratum]
MVARRSRQTGWLRRLSCGLSGRTLFFLVFVLCILLCVSTLRAHWNPGEPSPETHGLRKADRQTQAVPVPALPSQPPHLTTEAELRWTFCAAQGETCRCSGKVRWGNAGTWLEYEPAGALHCSIEALPDVIPGDTKKHCECLQPDVGVAGADESPSAPSAPSAPPAPSAPAEWRFCASQWQECRCHGTVRWGNEGQWHEVKPRPGESSVTVSCSVAQLPDVAPGDDGKHCQCSGSVFVPPLPPEALSEGAEPLVSCEGHGWSGTKLWELQLRKAMEPLCKEKALWPYLEVYLDTRFREQHGRLYGEDGWCEEAWVNFAARDAKGRRVSGYAKGLTDQMVKSVHQYSSKPVVVVSFGSDAIPFLDPNRFPRMVLLHARMKAGLSFSFSGLRAALLARVKVGVNIEEDMMFVSPQADTLFARTREEITELYPFPMLPTHFLDRDPANKEAKYGNFLEFTVPGSPDPRFPRPTLRWGQAQGTWSFWALPFVGRWLAAKLLGREEQGVPTRSLGEAEDLLNVGLWREKASKAQEPGACGRRWGRTWRGTISSARGRPVPPASTPTQRASQKACPLPSTGHGRRGTWTSMIGPSRSWTS